MLLNVINDVTNFLYRLIQDNLNADLIFYLALGFTALMMIIFMLKSRFAYEGRLERSLEKLNRWLYTHQQIDESNLVEFNNLVKKTPKLLRYHWQQYMLYREHEPSYYLSMYNLIEKPLHTSGYVSNIKNFMGISVVTMLVSFLLTFLSYSSGTLNINAIINSLISPLAVLLISVIFLIFLRASQNFTLSSLYQNLHIFNRYVDKASTTIPKYVDFEILFTRKEIRRGIPVLNEYLEKRARQEAEELERARQNAVEHEQYNFEDAGIDGSLILDRAMKESEIYLNTRQRILSQIQQLESEIDSLKRNYENTSKDYQRKLQASKENIERLRQQQEESTNRIEVNYIRKQQQDEIKKQEQLEKDQDDATVRYDQETTTLKEQIEKLRIELEEKKQYVTDAMLSEYDTFSTKIYKAILNDVQAKHKEEVDELASQKDEAVKELEKSKEINAIKDSVIEDLRQFIHKQEDQGADSNDVSSNIAQPEEEYLNQEENKPLDDQIDIESTLEEPQETQKEQLQELQENTEETTETNEQEKPQGIYDENGYFWFEDGTYYDDKGLYHALDGNIYDQDGNLIQEAEKPQDDQLIKEEIQPQIEQEVQEEEKPVIEQTPVEEEQPVEEQPVEEQPRIEETNEQTAPVEQEEEPKPVEEKFQEIEQEKIEEPKDVEEPVKAEQPVLTIDVETPKEGNEEKPKAKRGRPRKVVTENEEKPATPKKRGRPRKTTASQPKKTTTGKRGRPKKTQTEEVVAKEPAKKRGRPRKTETQTTTTPKTTTGKRGRPKKSTTSSASPKKTTTGKRGRPKKSTTTQPKKTTSGKRGRPRKTTTSTAPKTTTGKRGRPRKNQDELTAISNQILEESNRLMEQQNELNRQLGETLQQIKEQQEKAAQENAVQENIGVTEENAQNVENAQNTETQTNLQTENVEAEPTNTEPTSENTDTNLKVEDGQSKAEGQPEEQPTEQ